MKFRTILSHLLGLWGHAFRAPGISRPMPSFYGRKAFRIAGFSIPALVFLLLACGKPSGHRGAQQPGKVAMSREDSLIIASEIEHAIPENHARTMELIFGKPKYVIRNIGILVYDGVNDLDLMGPRYVLGQAMGANTKLIGIKPGHIQTVMGVEIVPETVIDSVTQLDILIIPGGFQGTIEAAYNKPLHDWIRKIDQTTRYTGAVCTGVWVLGATGLLENKKASTNWYRETEFLKKYKALPANQRYTQDGKYWTSAGVTAGMDMSLAIMKDIYGDRYAQAIMLDMEYDPHPPIEGGTPDKTNWAVRWMMKAMYDGGVNPLIHRLENKK
jgi:putative intracellular protease/amidase